MQDNKYLRILTFIVSGIIVFFSGKYLLDLDYIASFFDAMIMLVFLFALMPFLQVIAIILSVIFPKQN